MLPQISYSGDQGPILDTMSEQSTIISKHFFSQTAKPLMPLPLKPFLGTFEELLDVLEHCHWPLQSDPGEHCLLHSLIF